MTGSRNFETAWDRTCPNVYTVYTMFWSCLSVLRGMPAGSEGPSGLSGRRGSMRVHLHYWSDYL